MVLSKADLLNELKLQSEEVQLSSGTVIVHEITGSEYIDAYNSELSKDEKGEFDGTRFVALLATRCLKDEDGNRMFSDDEADLLRNGSKSSYLKIVKAVKRLNEPGGDDSPN